ncbi:D-tyrosyl-tRNA deacylase [Cutibacterium acnes JCM 18916]|nr:D-tyrosyl-tRNA deacylase [Cutibacterium acnes JCM 18916]
MVLVGVTGTDTATTAEKLAEKVWGLRILSEEKSASDLNAPLLVVSQFTLYASTVRAPPVVECCGTRAGVRAAGGPLRNPPAQLGSPRRDRNLRCRYEGGSSQRRPDDDSHRHR